MSCVVAHDVADVEHQAAFELQARMDAALGDIAEPVALIEGSIEQAFDGELHFIGAEFRAKVCVTEGRMAWVYCSTHGEHLGDVLERSLGLGADLLAKAMQEARRRQRKLGEWLVDEGLITEARLRECLREHLAAHLRALAFTTGEFEVAFVGQRHRYDDALLFSLDEIVATSVFTSVRKALSFVDALALVDPVAGRVLAWESRGDVLPDWAALELSDRVRRFARDVGSRCTSVFRSDRLVCCIQPLRTHPRLWLAYGSRDAQKVGLMVGRAAALEGTV